MAIIKVSIDGGQNWLDAPDGARVMYEGVSHHDEDDIVDLSLNHTHEGVITDILDASGVRETDCQEIDDIMARLS